MMSEFDRKGFLGTEAEAFVKENVKKHRDWFELCEQLNELAQETKYEIEIDGENGRDVVGACLFIRTLNDFQSVIILVKYGLLSEGKVILRSLLQSTFLVKLCSEDPDFVKKYIGRGEKRRLKLMNVARNASHNGLKGLRKHATDEVMAELKREIEAKNIGEMRVADMAREVGMEPYYDTVYRTLSDVEHVGVSSLQEYLVLNKEGTLQGFHWGPQDNELEIVIATALDLFSISLRTVCELFAVDRAEQIEGIGTRIAQLAK